MKVTDFLSLYRNDPQTQLTAQKLNCGYPCLVHLKGLVGSQDAVLAAALMIDRTSSGCSGPLGLISYVEQE